MTKESTIPNTNVKSYLDRAINIMNEQDTLAQDLKELKIEAKDNGVDMKAFMGALKEIRKPTEPVLKAKINAYLEEGGQFKLFAI